MISLMIWGMSTGTGQTSACGSITKVGQAAAPRALTGVSKTSLSDRGGGGGRGGEAGSLTMLFPKIKL